MVETITLREFNKLPLEERVTIALKNYVFEKPILIPDGESLNTLINTWAYIEKEDYAHAIREPPKPGAAYRLTKKGINLLL